MRIIEKDENYCLEVLKINYEALEKYFVPLRENKFPADSIPKVSSYIFNIYSHILILKYSYGEEIENIRKEYLIALEWMEKSWINMSKQAYEVRRGKKIYYNFYFDSDYQQMLLMLSFGVLFNLKEDVFQRLAKILDKDEIYDQIFEFILSKKINSQREIKEETYIESCKIPKRFSSLRLAIQDRDKASELIGKYLLKDWVKSMNSNGSFKIHESPNHNFVGYWNLESAAIALLLDVDVSSFENSKYFPKDLYYYAKRKIEL